MAQAPSSRLVLESGDRLSPEEFDRIYADAPNVRAELVNGVVYVTSPVRIDNHAKPFSRFGGLASAYVMNHPGVDYFQDGSFYTEKGDRVQPDLCIYKTTLDAGAKEGPDGFLRGSPEFIGEVAASSASYDLHDKKLVYQSAGVREYLVWRVLENEFDFFRLVEGMYHEVQADENGILESAVLPGLRFDTGALIAMDLSRAIAALR